MNYRRERIIVGFFAGLISVIAGAWIRLNAQTLSAVPEGQGVTSYPTDKVSGYGQIGIVFLAFGLMLLAIAFHHWLSPHSMSPDQS